MRYSEISEEEVRRDRYQHTHPVLAELRISGARWEQFQRELCDYDPAKLVSRRAEAGRMVAVVACLDDEVADLLADRWMT